MYLPEPLPSALFVTGTDTGVGKTHVAVALLRELHRRGVPALGYKPVASGCDGQGHNEDALRLRAASALPRMAYELVNPLALPAPVAPHRAAELAGVVLRPAALDAGLARLRATRPGAVVIVEGAGGWHVPLGGGADAPTLGEWARAAGLPVLLVVALRLGAINHALLSRAAIGGNFVGWWANRLPDGPPMAEEAATLACLRARLGVPWNEATLAGESTRRPTRAVPGRE